MDNEILKNIEIGQRIKALLNLTAGENGRVDTSTGDKTDLGLALTIKRIIDEVEQE